MNDVRGRINAAADIAASGKVAEVMGEACRAVPWYGTADSAGPRIWGVVRRAINNATRPAVEIEYCGHVATSRAARSAIPLVTLAFLASCSWGPAPVAGCPRPIILPAEIWAQLDPATASDIIGNNEQAVADGCFERPGT